MPLSAPHACTTPGCPALVRMGPRCPACALEHEARDRARRGTATQRGYGNRWQKYRLQFLAAHPLCVMCQAEQRPRVTAATVVDHIQAHKGDPRLMWDPNNHRAVCRPHHDQRTDEGDFGRPVQRTTGVPHG